ncbi:MAG TPA: alpha/beta hydrolase [Candidatus Binataceae bacterium]|nr:alpha/beta hydrolase [Candidatus Binataceae bacterium]
MTQPDRRKGIGRIRLRARIVALAVAIAIAGAVATVPARADSSQSSAGAFTSTGSPRALTASPGLYEWRFEATRGPSPFDCVGLHRVARGPVAPAHPRIVILYLPGTNMNGEVAIDEVRYSIQLYMAAHGADVWSLDYRTHFIPPDTPPAALAELKGWTNDLFASDIEAAARFVIATTHQRRIFVAGFSRGVEFAYLYAALHPKNVAGLIILDGYLPHSASTAPPPDRVADDIGGRHLTYDKRKALMEAVIRDPDGPAPIPQFKTASDNLAHVVHDSAAFGGNGGLANPQGGFSDPVVLARELITYDRYWPAVQDYDNPFSAARLETLRMSPIPVIAFASTNISARWPSDVEQSARSTGGAASFTRLDGWGHLDVICGAHSERDVFVPALAWIRRRLKPGPD